LRSTVFTSKIVCGGCLQDPSELLSTRKQISDLTMKLVDLEELLESARKDNLKLQEQIIKLQCDLKEVVVLRKMRQFVFINFHSNIVTSLLCLMTLCHNEDDYCCPPPFTRLGTCTVKVQTGVELHCHVC